ncbi:glycosyl hydrolase 5 family protein-like [Magnolia sinica]|uniref:glycosyl hydrolase 5 family protein-like n=1 Tax=Magnolia sinica TaxID=86752 RepID=UPI00265A0AB4|nr:glycosyl hydrolase 5 family protein-like [Magnolia sinica]
MLGKTLQIILLIAFSFICCHDYLASSLPLSTNSRWIIDVALGQRVKLHCVNWVAHMQPMIAEGLDRKPLLEIAAQVDSLGFNCVRLTWATFMFTNASYKNLTVLQSLNSLELGRAAAGIASNNPSLLGITIVEAYDAVVEALGEVGLMVVLDNHVSRPQWCCGNNDGNGFFGDPYFDPEEWLEGLAIVAKRFKGKAQVVGMSLQNELRGPRQSELGWYQQVRRGARTIHKINPNVLVIVSGLNYGTDLSFLGRRPLGMDLGKKLVYEAHWYAFSEGRKREWEKQSPSRICADSVGKFENRAGFVTHGNNATPLFISEFGVDQRGVNRADNRFLSCFLAFAAGRDMDWAMWALQGSYYLRNDRAGFEETYGVLDTDWKQPKNPKFQERFGLVHEMMQGMRIETCLMSSLVQLLIKKKKFFNADPGSNGSSYLILYHPLSGHCIEGSKDGNIQATDCQRRSKWIYNGNKTPIQLMGTDQCLRVAGNGLSPILSTNCSDDQSRWRMVSSSKLQIATMDAQGGFQCLEKSSSNSSTIITSQCLCLNESTCDENPETQWFNFVSSNLV